MIKRSQGLKTYFKTKNLRHGTVNGDIARYKISKIFDLYFNNKIEIGETIPLLKKDLKHLKFLFRKFAEVESYSTRTFDFSNKESDIVELIYISDRWTCASRLDWLIKFLEESE